MSKEKAIRAGAWSALDIILRQVVQFVVSIILARLLAPADFGLIALLGFFTSLSVTFVQGGLSLALVQRQNTSREEESAVFWVNLAASLVFAGGILLIAPVAAGFYGQPLLRSLMIVAAVQVVVSALGAVHAELLTRTLQFDQLTKTGIISSLVSAIAGVAAAVAGWGVWALAVQLLSATVVGTVAMWWISPWRPQWRFRITVIRDMYSFGAFISLSTVLELVYTNGWALILGKVYGLADLGILNRAFALQALPTNIISQIISRTALPLFSTRADDKPALARGLRLSISLAMIITTPMLVGLALLSDSVITVLYGAKWRAAAPLLSIIAVGGILFPLHVFNLQLLLSLGDSKGYLKLEVWKKIAGFAFLAAGCFFGVTGVAYASCATNVISLFINTRPAARLLDFGFFRQLRHLDGIFLTSGCMAAVVLVLRRAIHVPPLEELILCSAGGAVTYVAIGMLFRLAAFKEALGLGMLLFKRIGR